MQLWDCFSGLWFQWQFNFENLCIIILVCLVYLVQLGLPLISCWCCLRKCEWIPQAELWGVFCWGRGLVLSSCGCPRLLQCLWAGEGTLRPVGSKRLPRPGQITLMGSLARSACPLPHLLVRESVSGSVEKKSAFLAAYWSLLSCF